jgi:DNA-binding NarL/FixJ family response regulator
MSAAGVANTKMTVALVAGRTLRGQCLARFLELSGLGIRTVSLEDISEGLLDSDQAVDVVVIDTGEHTGGDPGVRTSFACLREALPGVPIVVVSDREDWSAVFNALELGARAYFPSSLDPEILIETLRFVQKGGTFIPLNALINASLHPKQPQGRKGPRSEMGGLTPSEQRVLALLKKGQPNKIIARELDIEETTVKVHVRRIMKKLNAANRTQAALVAQEMSGALA